MRINSKMIAKDLRLSGYIFKLFSIKNFKKAKFKNIKERKNISKKTYNVYLTRDDKTKLRVLVRKSKSNIGILWLHGGGHVLGKPEMIYLSIVRKLFKKATIVSPDYRLNPFPNDLEDCYLTLKWMVKNADKLNIRKDKIFVGGESAGGGLTVSLCLLARDKKEINIAYQMPIYPMLTNKNTLSKEDNNAPIWNEKQNKKAWKIYLDGVKDINKYALPLLENDFSCLPPCFSFVGTIDPFYEETKEYISRLKKANVEVSFKFFEGCYHAFDMMVPHAKESKEAVNLFLKSFDYAVKYYKKDN